MDKAKAAVASFISKDGKHQTSVDRDHAAAITEEHVRPHQHENVTTAVDREVHRDHHYTTVQPIHHKETLAENHTHNLIPVEHKTVKHGGDDEMKQMLDRDAAQYKDTSTTHSTTHSQATAPVVAGEHVHHHVHEHVQPVIHKETITPQVVHTTVPIHETHQAKPVHHGTTVAPAKTLDEWTSAGGALKGTDRKVVQEFEGCPQTESTAATGGLRSEDLGTHSHTSGSTKTGAAAAVAAAGRSGTTGSSTTASTRDSSTLGSSDLTSETSTARTSRDISGSSTKPAAAGAGFGTATVLGSSASPTSNKNTESRSFLDQDRKGILKNADEKANYKTGSSTSKTGTSAVPRSEDNTTGKQGSLGLEPWHAGETHKINSGTGLATGTGAAAAGVGAGQVPLQKRASLVDKINPFKDADGDGKKGFMK